MMQAYRLVEGGVARLCLSRGADAIDTGTIATFTDLSCQFLAVLIETASELATNSGRTEPTVDDVTQAVINMHGRHSASTELAKYVAACADND